MVHTEPRVCKSLAVIPLVQIKIKLLAFAHMSLREDESGCSVSTFLITGCFYNSRPPQRTWPSKWFLVLKQDRKRQKKMFHRPICSLSERVRRIQLRYGHE